MVAAEEGSVDFYSGNFTRCDAQTDDDPVGGLGVVATSFPAVVPCAGVDEDAWAADRGCRVYEVGGFGEPFVTEGEDFGAQRGGDEIWLILV